MSGSALVPVGIGDKDNALNETIKALESRVATLEALLRESSIRPSDSSADKDGVVEISLEIAAGRKEPDISTSNANGKELSAASTEAETSGDSAAKVVPQQKSRARTVFRKWDDATNEYKDIDAPTQSPAKVSEEEARAFTYRKIDRDEYGTETYEIVIEDGGLNNILHETAREVYPPRFYSAKDTVPWVIHRPLTVLVHCYDKLEQDSVLDSNDDQATKERKEDVRLLLEYVRNTNELVDYFKMRKDSPTTIAYRYLWTLFPPGIEVVAKPFLNQPQIFRTDHLPEFNTEERKTWKASLWCYDWTGIDWVKSEFRFKVESYEREKEIRELDFYPLAYYKDENQTTPEQFRAAAVNSGKSFKAFCELQGAARMVDYDDFAIAVENPSSRPDSLFTNDDDTTGLESSSDPIFRRQKIKDRVIVDAEAWYQRPGSLHLGDKTPTGSYEPGFVFNDDRIPPTPDGEWAALCPPRFYGLALKQKQFGQFKLSAAKFITSKLPEPYRKELQLGDDEKEILLGLVEQQEQRSKSENADFVANKGRSLVILLHGPPGVGKTLTAETLSLATCKPLFVVSVAEIGLEAEGAEAKLEKVFSLAQKWDAILLVDEADVFLESRSQLTTPNRNALVSVLLRVLEYYAGTIILTTNRITSLDPAVQSRIHLAIRYDDLNKAQRTKVFGKFLEKVGLSEEAREDLQSWFNTEAARKRFNGREIRNLISSAQSLANSKGVKGGLDRDSLRKILLMTEEFQAQLQEQVAEWKVANQAPGRPRM